MSLCSLCKAIPWGNLPTVPSDALVDFSGYRYLHEFVPWPEDHRGYLHHQNLEDLRSSANDQKCGICRLILKQVEDCQSELEDLKPEWDKLTQHPYAWPSWKLWIVKRQNGGDGVWVMSSTEGEYKETARLVAAIGLCVRHGNPLELVLRGRPVEEQPGTSEAISRVQNWVKGCNEHPDCTPIETFLPYRVVDAGDDINSPYVKLREIGGHEHGKYISLSYCWGQEPQFTTTKSTLEDRKRQITVSDLSQMHQDVIKLARSLGVRYIWIDSICICQGDYEDWARESGKMQSIYGNSYLTVAASKAKDHSEGLFNGTIPREYVEFEYTSGDLSGQALAFNLPLRDEATTETYLSLPDEPLSDRGWAFQERLLPRRTLHYTKQQMFFECKEGFRGEDGLFLEARFDNVHDMPGEVVKSTDELPESDAISSDVKSELIQLWYNLLWVYGPRKLTKASDKLPAISGIAGTFGRRLGDEYVAGIWRSHLLEGLLWQGLDCRRVPEYRAPSWSWASMDGIPGQGGPRNDDAIAKILDVKVDLKGPNPYGEVTGARLQIQAPMERLYLDIDDWDPIKPGAPYETNPPVRSAHDETYSRFDFDFAAEDGAQEAMKIVKSLEGKEFFALVLLKRRDEEDTYDAIMVKKVDGGEEYERLGYSILGEGALGRKPEDQPRDEFPIITLV